MFQKSDLTQKTHDLLIGVNGEVSYATLASHVGLAEFTPRLRSAVISARRSLEREHGIVFETVRGLGLRRLADIDVVRSTNAIRQSIHRKAKSGILRLGAVRNFADLPPQEQAQATINQTIFAMAQGASALAPKAPAAPVPPATTDAAALRQAFGVQ
jgi:ribosomal protein L30/L7E